MEVCLWWWVGFNVFVLAMLRVDLLVFYRKPHEVSLKEALVWSGVWIGLALVFNAGIYFWQGKQPALEFLTGYLIEKSLSVDNIFVFLMIFACFKVPAKYQHEVLFWGILGALLMRAGFIAGGVALIKNFHWIIYVCGGFLIFTGIKMALDKDKEIHPEKSLVLRLFRLRYLRLAGPLFCFGGCDPALSLSSLRSFRHSYFCWHENANHRYL